MKHSVTLVYSRDYDAGRKLCDHLAAEYDKKKNHVFEVDLGWMARNSEDIHYWLKSDVPNILNVNCVGAQKFRFDDTFPKTHAIMNIIMPKLARASMRHKATSIYLGPNLCKRDLQVIMGRQPIIKMNNISLISLDDLYIVYKSLDSGQSIHYIPTRGAVYVHDQAVSSPHTTAAATTDLVANRKNILMLGPETEAQPIVDVISPVTHVVRNLLDLDINNVYNFSVERTDSDPLVVTSSMAIQKPVNFTDTDLLFLHIYYFDHRLNVPMFHECCDKFPLKDAFWFAFDLINRRVYKMLTPTWFQLVVDLNDDKKIDEYDEDAEGDDNDDKKINEHDEDDDMPSLMDIDAENGGDDIKHDDDDDADDADDDNVDFAFLWRDASGNIIGRIKLDGGQKLYQRGHIMDDNTFHSTGEWSTSPQEPVLWRKLAYWWM